PVLDSQSLSPPFAWGVDAGIGHRWGDHHAVELTGFYIPEQGSTKNIAAPGLLDLPFFNAPPGFQGAHGLWLQADRAGITTDSALANGELNYRFTPDVGYGLDLIAGVRYFDLQDRFSVFTDEDGLTVFPANTADIATYFVHTHNHMLLGQLGVDWEHPLP